MARGTIIYRTTRVNERITTMDIQEAIISELVRLDVPIKRLRGFQLDQSEAALYSALGASHPRCSDTTASDCDLRLIVTFMIRGRG